MKPVETHNTTQSKCKTLMKYQEPPRHMYETYDFGDGDSLALETDWDFDALPKFRERLIAVKEWSSIIFKQIDSSKLDTLRALGEFLIPHSTIYQMRIEFDTPTDLSFLEKWSCTKLSLVWPLGTKVDLSPLSLIRGLQELSLYGVDGDTLDLSLFDTGGFKKLVLWGIDSDTLDLSTLNKSNIENIQILGVRENDVHYGVRKIILPQSKTICSIGIDGNKITDIDLTPLSHCPSLERFGISHEPLREIDLSPLAYCKRLKSFGVGKNLIETLDMTPLLSCPKLKSFTFVLDRPTLIVQRSQLVDTTPEIIKQFIERKHIIPV